MILAGDLGGTKVELALFDTASGLKMVNCERFASGEYQSFGDVVAAFLTKHKCQVRSACFGVAGPVVDQSCTITNLAWVIEAKSLGEQLGIPNVTLLNDLEATGYGVPLVPSEGLVCLNRGRPRSGNVALIAAGTGLGECILFWDGKRHVPSPSEGGHADFGPTDQGGLALLQYLLSGNEHVSWERVVSGSLGFRNIYSFLRDQKRFPEDIDLAAQVLAHDDVGAVVAKAASFGSVIAQETMRLFAKFYGAETGNLALKAMAVGGMYLAGGIAPKILPWLQNGVFLEAFKAKGRFRQLLEDIPVNVITDPYTALKGAAWHALLQLS